MRWICKDDIEECLNEAWRVRANALKEELINETDHDKRKLIINRNSDVWREYYELLPENLKKKCWYCEAKVDRSDIPVDHFRPKNKVEGCKDHLGYWWLAFDWENYRCACTYCNSRRKFEESEGGKACKFPISNPEQRIKNPEGDISVEQVHILDPFNDRDEKLLWFDNDGKPIPRPDATDYEIQKVTNSIDVFHLHESGIVRSRNEIRIRIERLVKKLRKNSEDEDSYRELKKMVRETEIFSRAAIVYLRAHRDIPQVKEILNLD